MPTLKSLNLANASKGCLCTATMILVIATIVIYTIIWSEHLGDIGLNRMIWAKSYDLNAMDRPRIIRIMFIDGVHKRPGGGPLAAQNSTKEALISYSSDPIKSCQSISSLPLLNTLKNKKPIYFKHYKQNIKHRLITKMFHIDVEFNGDDNKLYEKNMILMTCMQHGHSRDVFYKIYPKLYKYNNTNTIFVAGSNIEKKDIINFGRDKNAFFISADKLHLDRYKVDEDLKNARSSLIGYIPNPLNNELTNIALYYVSGRNETLWNSYQLRTKCIAYIKKDPPFSSYTIAMGHKYNCIIFKYGEYNRSYFIEIAKQSSFAIISDLYETQGYAFMELMAYNVPLFIVEWRYKHYINHQNDSPIFHNFDNSLCGHLCVFDSDHLNEQQSINELNHCLENIFFKNIKNGLYKPAMFVLREFNQCDYVQTLIDITIPFMLGI